jgi:hypothetical protein
LPPVSAFANCFAAEPPSRSLLDESERLRARPPDRFDVAAPVRLFPAPVESARLPPPRPAPPEPFEPPERFELPRADERADPFEPPELPPLGPRFVSAIDAPLQRLSVPHDCGTRRLDQLTPRASRAYVDPYVRPAQPEWGWQVVSARASGAGGFAGTEPCTGGRGLSGWCTGKL